MVDDLASPIAPLHTLSIAASMRVGGSCAPLLRARSIASPRSPRRTGGCSLSSVFIRDCLARRARGVLTSRRASLPAQPPAASMRVGLPIPSHHHLNRIASRLQRGRAATAFHRILSAASNGTSNEGSSGSVQAPSPRVGRRIVHHAPVRRTRQTGRDGMGPDASSARG